MNESDLKQKTEEQFNDWTSTQSLESISLKDIYECAFRHGVEAAGVEIKDD